MTQTIDIAALRRIAESAPAGPWHAPGMAEVHDAEHNVIAYCAGLEEQEDGSITPNIEAGDAMARYVSAFDREVALALLDRLERAEKEREELLAMVPRTPEQAIAFIGTDFNSMRFQDGHGKSLPSEDVTYSLTVHDLLSAFFWAGFYDFAVKGEDKC